MQSVNKIAQVDHEKCTRCADCIRVCPVEAITMDRSGNRPAILVDEKQCLSCTICVTRCPEQAFVMVDRVEPLYFGIDHTRVDQAEVEAICRSAHMYPEQIICYCRRINARDVAAAILLGHRTPEALARATGIRTGCGVLCITSVLRQLKAAGIDLEKAPGWQWYGTYMTIWDISDEIAGRYPEYYVAEDRAAMDELFPKDE